MLKGKDNKITAIDGTGSSVGIIAAWVHKFVLGVENQPELDHFLTVFTTCTPFHELPQQTNLLQMLIEAMGVRLLQIEQENIARGATSVIDQLSMAKTLREELTEGVSPPRSGSTALKLRHSGRQSRRVWPNSVGLLRRRSSR